MHSRFDGCKSLLEDPSAAVDQWLTVVPGWIEGPQQHPNMIGEASMGWNNSTGVVCGVHGASQACRRCSSPVSPDAVECPEKEGRGDDESVTGRPVPAAGAGRDFRLEGCPYPLEPPMRQEASGENTGIVGVDSAIC